MSPNQILPFITTAIMFVFAGNVIMRYMQRHSMHLLMWAIGLTLFAVGSLTEASHCSDITIDFPALVSVRGGADGGLDWARHDLPGAAPSLGQHHAGNPNGAEHGAAVIMLSHR